MLDKSLGGYMDEKKTFQYEGRSVSGEGVDFESKGEHWNHYDLADGSTVKVKLVLLDAIRLDEFNEAGDPIYQFASQQIIGVQAAPNLRKRTQ